MSAILKWGAALLNGGLDPATCDPTKLSRVRAVSGASLLMFLVGAPFVARYQGLGVPLMAWAVAGTMVFNLANLVLLLRSGRAALCGNLAALSLFTLLVLSNVASGGFYDPNFAWLYVVPAGAALLVGPRAAVLWAGVVVMTTAVFWALPELGYPLQPLIPADDHAEQSLLNRVTAVVALALMTSAFVSAQRRAEDGLHNANRALAEEAQSRARAEQEARAADRAKTAFLATMSHELRTPMHATIGTASLLLETELNPEQAGYVRTVHNSGQALLNIIDEILDLSKIEAGGLELEVSDLSLVEVAEDVAQLVAPLSHQKGLQLVLQFDPNLPERVRGDAGRVRQILLNLVGNAVKFTDEGHVLVRLSETPGEDGGHQVRMVVEDTGAGLSEQDAARVFDAFAQAGAEPGRTGGTGLGLTISLRLARLMGGDISLHSTPGKGSTFTVELALSPARGASVRTATTLPKGRRVLVADGHRLSRQTLVERLRAWGVECEGVADAKQLAVAWQDAQPPWSHSLVDAQLPGGLQRLPQPPGNVLCLRSPGHPAEPPGPPGWPRINKPLSSAVLRQVLGSAGPVVPLISTRPPPPTVSLAPLSGDVRVLVADDNAMNRELVAQMLEKLGCVTDFEQDGEAAVERYRSGRYDVVLMDCRMPRMDGYEACRRIRALESGERHVPIVAVTANASAQDRDRAHDAGMDEVLSKPFGYRDLAGCLERYVGTGRLSESPSPAGAPAVVGPDLRQQAIASITTFLPRHSNGPERAEHVLDRFLGQAPSRVRAIEEALAERDVDKLGEAAHALKGASGFLGITRLSDACTVLVEVSRRGELPANSNEADTIAAILRGLGAGLGTRSSAPPPISGTGTG